MLPALRQDLTLHAGPSDQDGSPTWTLHDPAANRFYRLGWSAFELLSRWSLNDAALLVNTVNQETTLHTDSQDVRSVLDFLAAHHLIDAVTVTDTRRLMQSRNSAKLTRAKWLLKNYLFVRIPLFRPAALLSRCAPYVGWVFDVRFWLAILCTALFGIVLASRQWDQFLHTFSAYSTFSGWLGIGVALSLAKVLHELGHALTAQRYGCRVPTMGVALLVMLPVLYTDTNEAWKLPAKWQRLKIGAAGMLAELALASVATLLWNFLPDGALRAGVFLLATSTWIVTLGINASPFMRFDGYFLLSDWLDMPNLHSRAFALARWWMRGTLFGWNDPVPESFAPHRQRFLIGFALVTWIYRLVVFLGIAFLVYHIAFKLLGIFLLMIELGWFIALPMVTELNVWWKNKHRLTWNRATRRTLLMLLAVLALLVLPWRSNITAPGVLEAGQAQGLYSASAARVVTAALAAGTLVAPGQVLVQLESPDLQEKLEQARLRERLVHWELDQQSFDPKLKLEGPALAERWKEAVAYRKGFEEQVEQLVVRAPFAGRIAEVNDNLVAGAWVAQKEKLFQLVGNQGAKAQAFVTESELSQLDGSGSARFVPDSIDLPEMDCQVGAIDHVNVSVLDTPYVASIYGGAIAVQKDRHGNLVPIEAWYRVHLNACGQGALAPNRELRGVLHLRGGWHSIAGTWFGRWIAVVQREMGF